jgi:hypothetical protein
MGSIYSVHAVDVKLDKIVYEVSTVPLHAALPPGKINHFSLAGSSEISPRSRPVKGEEQSILSTEVAV